jgi:D-3-phosphoglycerate dehydrogenase
VNLVKILVTDKIHDDGIKMLEEIGEVDVKTGLTPKELLEEIKRYDVLVVRSATKVTKEVIDEGKQLKIIARAGVGLDSIDVQAANSREIKLINAPEGPTIAVAELVIGLMLSWARKLPQADSSMKQGRWEKTQLMGSELRGKTLGIIGTGRIGKAVGYMAKAFLMDILAFDVKQDAEFIRDTGARYVDLEELLRKSDFVSLHVPATSQTRHIIEMREIELMKPSAVLVNTSRGEVIDEAALTDALKRGKIAGACLDVYEREPPKDSPLLKLPNVVLTPHIGASTVEAQREAALIIAEKIKIATIK